MCKWNIRFGCSRRTGVCEFVRSYYLLYPLHVCVNVSCSLCAYRKSEYQIWITDPSSVRQSYPISTRWTAILEFHYRRRGVQEVLISLCSPKQGRLKTPNMCHGAGGQTRLTLVSYLAAFSEHLHERCLLRASSRRGVELCISFHVHWPCWITHISIKPLICEIINKLKNSNWSSKYCSGEKPLNRRGFIIFGNVCGIGLSIEGNPDVMGEPDHGHAGLASSCHRAAVWGAASTEAIWPHEATHLTHDDEEHHWSRCLSDHDHPYHTLRRFVSLVITSLRGTCTVCVICHLWSSVYVAHLQLVSSVTCDYQSTWHVHSLCHMSLVTISLRGTCTLSVICHLWPSVYVAHAQLVSYVTCDHQSTWHMYSLCHMSLVTISLRGTCTVWFICHLWASV